MLVTLLLLQQTLEGDPRAPRLPGTVQTFCKLFGLCHTKPALGPCPQDSHPRCDNLIYGLDIWPVLSLPCGVFCYLAAVLGELLPRLAGRGS